MQYSEFSLRAKFKVLIFDWKVLMAGPSNADEIVREKVNFKGSLSPFNKTLMIQSVVSMKAIPVQSY